MILKIAEIDNPAVNELLNLHNIRVDEEFLHDPTCILQGPRRGRGWGGPPTFLQE